MIQQLTEKQIQTQVIQYLRYMGFYVMRLNSGAIRSIDGRGKQRMIRLSEVGTPDVMAFKSVFVPASPAHSIQVEKTILYFFEIKRKGNKPTRMQEIKMQELEEKGAICHVIHSIEELEKVII